MSSYEYKTFDVIKDHILVHSMDAGEKNINGIIRLDDTDFKDYNIKPRWAKVWKIGPTCQHRHELKEGDYILISHGQWTKQMEITINGEKLKIQRVKPSAILLVSEEKPSTY